MVYNNRKMVQLHLFYTIHSSAYINFIRRAFQPFLHSLGFPVHHQLQLCPKSTRSSCHGATSNDCYIMHVENVYVKGQTCIINVESLYESSFNVSSSAIASSNALIIIIFISYVSFVFMLIIFIIYYIYVPVQHYIIYKYFIILYSKFPNNFLFLYIYKPLF
jgi:hypothetical protein